MTFKLFVSRHLGAQVTTGRYGQNKAFGYYCTFTVSDYEFGFIFLQWALTLFHGKNIKVLRDPKQYRYFHFFPRNVHPHIQISVVTGFYERVKRGRYF